MIEPLTDVPTRALRAALSVVCIAGAMSLATLAGCAPDSVRNFEAKGFDTYLDSLRQGCPNMTIGNHNVSEWLRTDGEGGGSDYVVWLDQTSRLYYRRITPAQYRDGVIGNLGPDKNDGKAIDCIIRKLPPDRPRNPTGGPLL
jgi:hypothetical protein